MNRDFFLMSSGRMMRKDNTIYIEKESGEKKSIPIENVESLHLYGEVDFNTRAIDYIAKSGVLIHFYNYYGFYNGSFYPRKKNVSGFLVVKQAMKYNVFSDRLYLAKCFVDSATHHIVRNMRNYGSKMGDYITKILVEREKVDSCKSIEEVMGCEGRIHKYYYSSFNEFLKEEFYFEKREKRPPKDPINALISFSNSLIYTTTLSEIYKTGLDPTISFLHEPSTKRFSLSLDIAEIFKPLIGDSVIFKLINKRILNIDDFDVYEGICRLNEDGRRKFLSEFNEKLETTIKHRTLNRKVSYRSLIGIECYKIIKHCIDDEIYKPLKAWW
ncbi:MAG: type I-B CRISPR-associated endonuclease Cas1b [Oscillospiraceae bacterium]|nr:type I-B CRISPR-associated endonuclease Cas1b [Oscillospiraceae bacterium]